MGGAVLVTHAHPDHMVDLHGLLRARWFGRPSAAPIPLHAPEPVLLTHFWPDNDRQAARAAAEAAFGGEVLIAEEDLEVQLGPMGPAGLAG